MFKLFILTVAFSLLLRSSAQISYNESNSDYEIATLGGGCFWCMEAIFERIPGVVSVESGYAGGKISNPTYLQVKSGTTGYAEVIQIVFDPKKLSYTSILHAFFYAHDPTSLNRQGIDVGHQYRSAIFYHNDIQKKIALSVVKYFESKGLFEEAIVTEVAPLLNYYPAEDYHQNYFNTFQDAQFCTIDTADIAMKIEKFFHKFNDDECKQMTVENEQNILDVYSSQLNIKPIPTSNPFHPWHHIGLGGRAPDVVNGVIEIQKGSRAKYEIDKASGLLSLDRIVDAAYSYPVNYGFVPQTLYEDGDPLDIIIFSSVDLEPLTLVRARVVGIVRMLDDNQKDDKILAVVDKDSSFSHIDDITDFDSEVISDLTKFFENYKKLENGLVVVQKVEGKDAAYKSIKKAIRLYRDVYVFSA